MNTMPDQNRAVIQRLLDAWNRRRSEPFDNLVASNVVLHCEATPGLNTRGPKHSMGVRIYGKRLWKAVMRVLVRIYTSDYSLYVYNSRAALTDDDIRRMYGGGASMPSKGKQSYSEYGQDAFVLRHIYKSKANGIFVDIGANHPTLNSNTYLLELNGWTGLAIEPQQWLSEQWPGLRKTPCLDCVAGSENKDVVFVEATEQIGLSGVDGFNKVSGEYTRKTVKQKVLKDILREHGIEEIDYLSIDVEGYEMNVLQGIDFERVKVRLIGVENDLGFRWLPLLGKRLGFELGSNEIRRYLRNRGFKQIARIVCDDFFIPLAD
jgi:FkbM family methyltransferase